ncbi:MAG TPA: RimK/LysX family protein [Nitrospirales bacterium]|nr:RimK/LysX family protein [Nitrospirales bacterium]
MTELNGRLTLAFMLTFGGALFQPPTPLMAKDHPIRAGWVEEVILIPDSIRLEAKLDTGAKSASLHAENLSTFSKDNERWVRFDITAQDGKHTTLERKVHRTVKIKQHERESSERPVILLDLCLGTHIEQTEVNLTDRSNYKYPLLIGRMFLSGHFIVDSSTTHLLKPDCSSQSKK